MARGWHGEIGLGLAGLTPRVPTVMWPSQVLGDWVRHRRQSGWARSPLGGVRHSQDTAPELAGQTLAEVVLIVDSVQD